MSDTVGQVANLPGQIGNPPHAITFLRRNSRYGDSQPENDAINLARKER
jgi:hypothetical protein